MAVLFEDDEIERICTAIQLASKRRKRMKAAYEEAERQVVKDPITYVLDAYAEEQIKAALEGYPDEEKEAELVCCN